MTVRLRIALSVAIASLAVPFAAHATSVWHPANNEAGVTFHPEHNQSTKTRADVVRELERARKDGSLALLQRGAAIPDKSTVPAKTRQQVIDELRNESPQERRERMELLTGGN